MFHPWKWLVDKWLSLPCLLISSPFLRCLPQLFFQLCLVKRENVYLDWSGWAYEWRSFYRIFSRGNILFCWSRFCIFCLVPFWFLIRVLLVPIFLFHTHWPKLFQALVLICSRNGRASWWCFTKSNLIVIDQFLCVILRWVATLFVIFDSPVCL